MSKTTQLLNARVSEFIDDFEPINLVRYNDVDGENCILLATFEDNSSMLVYVGKHEYKTTILTPVNQISLAKHMTRIAQNRIDEVNN